VVGGGEGAGDLQAAVGAGVHAQVGAVGGGDRGDDRQAKAVAVVVAGAVGAAALEGPQQPAQLGGGTAGPLLATASSAPHPGGAGLDPDPACGLVVADGVVHQVGDQPLGQARVAQDPAGVQGGVDAELAAARLGVAGQQHLVGDRGQVNPLPAVQAGLAAGQDQQGVQQPLLLLAGGQDAAEGGPQRPQGGVAGSARATSTSVR
jgi:hypothetical protein